MIKSEYKVLNYIEIYIKTIQPFYLQQLNSTVSKRYLL